MSLATLVLAAALNPGGLIAWIVIGLLAGWLAGVIMPGKGFGLIGDLVIGLVGAFLGVSVLNVLAHNQNLSLRHTFLVAFIGACNLVRIVHAATRNSIPI